jgi:hypothetical protein
MGGAGIPINSSGVPSFFIKKIAKGVKSAVKGAVGAVKDVVSSDVGKLALLAAGGYYLGGLGGATGLGRFAPSAMKAGLLGTVEAGGTLYGGGLLSGLMNTGVGQAVASGGIGSLVSKVPGGIGTIAAVGGALLPSLFGGSEQKAKEAFARDPQGVKNYLVQYFKNLNKDATDEEAAQFAEEQTREYAADGGRIGFEEGGMGNNMEDLSRGLQIDTTTYSLGEDPQFEKITVPKEKPIQKYLLNEVMSERGMNTLSEDTREMFMKELAVKAFKKGQISREEYNEIMGIEGKKDGGIMNIPMGEPRENQQGVKELDYRKEGGFVPVGIKEKADDVPAMLSKNEFVFTADAVRGAGEGDVEKGAQRMYKIMKTLENGGTV